VSCDQRYTCTGDGTVAGHIERILYVMDHEVGYRAAVEEAKASADEGGIPIGACLVSKEGKILGRGHNMRVQKGSATLHVWPPSS